MAEYIGKYRIEQPLYKNDQERLTFTYRVTDQSGTSYFLKTFNPEYLPKSMFTTVEFSPGADMSQVQAESVLQEIEAVLVDHPHLVRYVDHGKWNPQGRGKDKEAWPYFVTEWVDGILLSDYIDNHRPLSWEQMLGIVNVLASALSCLHERGWAHNDLTPSNVMISPDGDPKSIKLIDLTHTAGFTSDTRPPFYASDLNMFYRAPEHIKSIYNASTDVFSLAAVLYTMATGLAPWQRRGESGMTDMHEEAEVRRRQLKDPLSFPAEIPYAAKVALLNALYRQEDRPSLDDFLHALSNDRHLSSPPLRKGQTKDETAGEESSQTLDADGLPEFCTKLGPGFEAVAGMTDILLTLKRDIIHVYSNIDKARSVYRITLPNGILLWGPKGCGKSFVISKFAEQSGYNYALVHTSDLLVDSEVESSRRLADLFAKAQSHAPAVICFDEIDALTPDRAHDDTPILVNEFLSQLNKCSDRGILVFGTTNRPEMIEPSLLRTGRFDKVIYVPVPDVKSRKALFSLYMKGRRQEQSIDILPLAESTEGYTASDIEAIVNQASILAFYEDKPISGRHLQDAVTSTPSSLSDSEIAHYESLRKRF